MDRESIAVPVLDYVAATPSRVFVPWWLRWTIALLVLPVMVITALAISPKNGVIDYTQTVTLFDVVAYSRTSPDFRVQDVTVLALMVASTARIVFARTRRATLVTALVACVLPALYIGPFLVLLPFFAVTVLPSALAGKESGEEWSEGLVCGGMLGLWQIIWLTGGVVAWMTTRSESHPRGPVPVESADL